jgi:hypothetical protein
MATQYGWQGSVYSGANKVAEITDWDMTVDGSPEEVTAFTDEWQKFAYTIRRANGNVAGFHDHTDTNGQVAIVNQFFDGGTMAVVWLYLYVSGSKGYYGEAVVTPQITANVAGINKFACPWKSHGKWYKMP